MALSISLKLIDSDNKALANQTLEIGYYNLAGRIQRLASGRTDPSGSLKSTSNFALNQYLPRIILRLQRNRKWINLTNTPKSFSRSKLDFGTVQVSKEPTLTVANTAFHRIPSAVLGATAGNNQLLTLKNDNDSLKAQLKESQEQHQRLSVEFDALKRLPRSTTSSTADAAKISALTREKLDLSNLLKIRELRIKELEAQPDKEIPIEIEEVSTDAVISSALDALNKADQANNGRFQLRSASMELKVLPGSSDNKVRLLKNPEAIRRIDPKLFNTLNIGLGTLPNLPAKPPTPAKPKMPDLTGYTRSLAQRRLIEHSLVANWLNQQLHAGDEAAAGTIISQIPKPGTALNEQTEITLIIGIAHTLEN